MSFDDAWRHAESADGWLTMAQGAALYAAASEVPAGRWIVEIGSHCGRSTVLLGAAKGDGVHLLAVDPFDDPRWGGGPEAIHAFEANLRAAGLLDAVQVYRGLSVDAARDSTGRTVGLLFIDGAHDEPSVLADIDGWASLLDRDAVVLLHDAYSSPGVTTAIFRRFFGTATARYGGAAGSLVRMDLGAVTPRERLWSMVKMSLRLGWFARNLLVKVGLRRRWYLMSRMLLHQGHDYPY